MNIKPYENTPGGNPHRPSRHRISTRRGQNSHFLYSIAIVWVLLTRQTLKDRHEVNVEQTSD